MELNNQRIITTKSLAESFGTEDVRIQQNFLRNKERFTEGKHFYKLCGEELKEFKANYLNDSSLKYASELILWTEKGAARHAKILDTDEAWEVYEQLEETYFRVKEQKPACIEDLIIMQAQSLKDLRQQINQVNYHALAAKAESAAAKEEVQAIREVVEIRPSDNWRVETNNLVRKICFKLNDYQKPKEELYKAVQERAACDLKRRLENMRARFLLNGGSKSKSDNMNYLDVIAEDKKLIEIYTAIVKELAIKYKIA
jgi:hypothetical protein